MVGMPGVVTLTLETLNLLLLFAGVLGYHPRENLSLIHIFNAGS